MPRLYFGDWSATEWFAARRFVGGAVIGLVLAAVPPQARTEDLALVGATIVDVGHFGTSEHDLANAVVVLRGGRITAVGPRASVAIPEGARVIDLAGRYLVPGLIDGFAAQRSRGQAKAHLAMGVTTIIGMSDDRRGLLMEYEPEPRIKRLDTVSGYDQSGLDPTPATIGELRERGRRLTPAELDAYVATKAWDGYEVLLLYYSLDNAQVRTVVQSARRRHVATIGELGHASYVDAARAGVQAFVHLNRFASELAPPELRLALADNPFPGNSGPLRERFETFLGGLRADQPAVRHYASELAATPAALMPTATLFVSGTELDPHNPWRTEVGALVDPHDVHLPLNPASGAAPPGPSPAADQALMKSARSLMQMQSAFVEAGVHYLAASGTTAFGVLPGDGLHWELALLTRLGLTPRQALAAATSNYASLFGWTDRGEIAKGRLADIVVLTADPTRSIGNARSIERVILNGVELDRAALLRPER